MNEQKGHAKRSMKRSDEQQRCCSTMYNSRIDKAKERVTSEVSDEVGREEAEEATRESSTHGAAEQKLT